MNASAMDGGESAGVVFPAAADGRRSTSALGRAVVADALRPVDPAGALGAEHETNWRSGYLVHFRRLIEAGLASKRPGWRSPATGWTRCTPGCGSPRPAGTRPASAPC